MIAALTACGPDRATPEVADSGVFDRKWDLVRIVTWNVETVGTPGSAEYDAALDVLARLDADVVAIQEVADLNDQADLLTFAADAGYGSVALGWPAGFGADHTAVLSRRAFVSELLLDSPMLSGDPAAADITRNFQRVEIETLGDPLVLVTSHWKCCSSDMEEFRRSVESARAVQALDGVDPALDGAVVLGDMNEDVADLPLSPGQFNALPAGLPATYWLGQDLYDTMIQSGIDNDPFSPLRDFGLDLVDASQRDGDVDTFITGGTLDYAWTTPALRLFASEVYDDTDEGLPTSLHLGTAPLPAGTVSAASDHHPLVIEVGVRK